MTSHTKRHSTNPTFTSTAIRSSSDLDAALPPAAMSAPPGPAAARRAAPPPGRRGAGPAAAGAPDRRPRWAGAAGWRR